MYVWIYICASCNINTTLYKITSYYGLRSKYGLILFQKIFRIKRLLVILGLKFPRDMRYLLPLGFDFNLLEALFYYKQA